jgi:hypothetical protein
VLGVSTALAAAALAVSAGDRPDDAAPAAAVRGCAERVEGDPLRPRPGRDTIAGPVAFVDLPGSYRYSLRHRGTPMKSVALVEPGARVTLVVPREMRAWLRLGYAGAGHVVTLQACRHARSRAGQRRECGWEPVTACRDDRTYFSGGVDVDFDAAPQQGRCGAVVVHVAGRERPLRRHLFAPPRGACG